MAQLPSIFIYVVLRMQRTAKSHLRLLGGPCRVRKRYRVPGEEFANLCERKDTASISLHERPLCRRVVCALHPHSFRHTFASQLLQNGESPAYVQRQLGHSSIKM